MTSPTVASPLSPDTEGSLDKVVPPEADVVAYRLGADTAVAVRAGQLVRWLIPLETASVYRLGGLTNLAYETGAEPLLVLPAALNGSTLPKALAGDDRLFAWDFVAYRMLGEDIGRLSANRVVY